MKTRRLFLLFSGLGCRLIALVLLAGRGIGALLRGLLGFIGRLVRIVLSIGHGKSFLKYLKIFPGTQLKWRRRRELQLDVENIFCGQPSICEATGILHPSGCRLFKPAPFEARYLTFILYNDFFP
jgi:hypothetical protein